MSERLAPREHYLRMADEQLAESHKSTDWGYCATCALQSIACLLMVAQMDRDAEATERQKALERIRRGGW